MEGRASAELAVPADAAQLPADPRPRGKENASVPAPTPVTPPETCVHAIVLHAMSRRRGKEDVSILALSRPEPPVTPPETCVHVFVLHTIKKKIPSF